MKRTPFCRLLVLLVFSMLVVFTANEVQAGRTSRDLVFEEEEGAPPQAGQEGTDQAQTVTGVKVTLELERDGQISTVLPSHEFKSGDRVKILYSTNIDCYVYWMSEGTSGDYFMLFPNPKAGTDNWVKKNEAYTIPVKGAFRFDEPKGVEKILLVMSPQKLPELEEAAKEASIKGGKVEDSSVSVASVREVQESKRKNRDLVFEEAADESTGVVTKTQVSNDIDQPFVVSIDLVHK